MREELHLFIIWKNALYKKDDIINDIEKKFEIINMYNVTWSDKKYSENLSRFYGVKLLKDCEKEKHCGRGTFLLIIVKDNNPKYDYRKTTAGVEFVNINMFDAKALYRKMTGGGHKIHCTNSLKETNHDLTLLLDKNIEDYLKDVNINKTDNIINLEKDLFGANGFNSVSDMFYSLNNCIDYAILRNYETLPDEIYVNKHNDIDVICTSRENAAYILNAKKAQDLDYRVQYHVDVEGKIANFDLRYVGDKYYDEDLENDLLKNRIWNEKGFYTLSAEDYFYTLLYHALIHKLHFSDDYKEKLMKLNKQYTNEISCSNEKSMKFLEKWMIENRYIIERPVDETVHFNLDNLQFISKLIYRENLAEIELRSKNKELEEELKSIKFSRTWRYTSFIRDINHKIKKMY